MRVEYFEDTDTLQITFNSGTVVDARDLDESTLVELDVEGRLVTMTIEHAQERTDVESFIYKTHRARLASVLAEESAAPEGRIDRLERQGLLHRARAPKDPSLFSQPRPQTREGASVLKALLEERRPLPAEVLKASGFIGCGEASPDLSDRYKEHVAPGDCRSRLIR